MLSGRFLWLMLLFSTPVAAQSVITLPNPEIYFDTKFTTKDLFLRRIDTTLENFHRYNPTSQWNPPHIALSNLAQAPRPLQFSPDRYVGFRHGYHAYDRYFYTSDSVRYYNTKTPFTSAYYMNGAKEERAIHVIHSQNITPNINLGFDYRRLVSESFFNRNKAGIHNFNLFNWYRSNNNKYNLMASYTFNQVKAMENGGVAVDDIFTNTAYSRDLRTAPVRLQQADNRLDNSNLSIRQSLFFGPTYVRQIDDSTSVETVKPRYGLTHHMELRGYKVRYTDGNARSGFYENAFIDTISTNDSTRIRSFSNEFVFQNYVARADDSLFRASELAWRGGLRYVLHRWNQMGLQDYRHGLQLFGGVQTNPFSTSDLRFLVEGTLDVAPQYAGDFQVEGKLLYAPGSFFRLEPYLKLNLQSPAYRWERTIGNHFQWENDFKKTFIAETGLQFEIPKWLLKSGISHQLLNNYLYVEEDLQPTQTNQALNVIRVFASKNFSWKRFYLGNEVSAQWVSNNDIIRMPAVWLRQQFYYKGTYIKKKPIHAFFGFDLTYFSNHSGDAWNPALMAFHVQRQEQLKFYPVLDVFFDLQIKRARLFFQMQHINQGLIWDGYYASPGYPMPPRALKLGVSWQFYD
jgi:hypothetical protein